MRLKNMKIIKNQIKIMMKKKKKIIKKIIYQMEAIKPIKKYL